MWTSADLFGIVRLDLNFENKAREKDSHARAHTWRIRSLMHKIFRHDEYSAPMTRLTKSAQNVAAH